jgi:monoterpene epsilon-lactone hydrolase
MMVSKQYKHFLSEYLAHPPIPEKGSLKEKRDAFERFLSQYPPPSDIRFEPFSIGPLPACWAFARGVNKHHVLLFFYGGGYIAGSVRSHFGIMGRLSLATGCAVLGVNYRLAPENPFPAAINDALSAYKWLLHHPYPHNHIAFAGVSAGGGLALSLMLRLKQEKLPLPAAGICICPWVDLAKTTYTDVKDIISKDKLLLASQSYVGDHDPKNPLISPLYGDLEGLPPLLIHTGTKELLYEEIIAFADKAKKSKTAVTLKKFANLAHTWHLFASDIPEGQKAINQIGIYLKKIFV